MMTLTKLSVALGIGLQVHGLHGLDIRHDIPVVVCDVQTEVVPTVRDAVDDPSIWVHPMHPELSLIIGTEKRHGLYVYDLSGKLVAKYPDGRMNNVDVLHAVRTGVAGETTDLVFASNRTDQTIAAYRIDPSARRLTPLEGGPFPSGMDEVYGLCAYLEPSDGTPRVVVNDKTGRVLVFAFEPDSLGRWSARVVREFMVGGQVEGCVADVHHGWLYIGEENVGVWIYPLNADSDEPRRLLDVVRTPQGGHLAADVEGITLYDLPDGEGWIIVSCQGEDRFAVYERRGGRYAGSFRIEYRGPDGEVDPVTHTDGIAATSRPLGSRYPRGIFVAQDDRSGPGQNFKIVDWRSIESALRLEFDPGQ